MLLAEVPCPPVHPLVSRYLQVTYQKVETGLHRELNPGVL